MLPARHRLRDARQYRAVLRDRRSGRAGGSLLVVHVADTDAFVPHLDNREGPRVGFVVSKAVGNAVVRSRTKRILRHLVAAELAHTPDNLDIVVRANPAIAGAASAVVAPELQRMMKKARSRMSGEMAERDDT